jgi:hypothetical protein
MAKERIGSNAIFTGPQLGLTVIQSHCYAFSGVIDVNDSETDLLNFHTGKQYIRATVRFCYGVSSSDNYLYKIKYNGQIVMSDASAGTTQAHWNPEYEILIPPLTEVIMTAINQTGDYLKPQSVVLVGKVYE